MTTVGANTAGAGADCASELDRAALREVTPGVEHVIHLNNAGAGLVPTLVTEEMVAHLELEARIGAQEAAATAADRVAAGRETVGRLMGAPASQVAFVESSTVALHRIMTTIPFRRGDRVLVAASEYGSTVLPLIQMSRRSGLRVDVIPDGPDGTTDPAALTAMLTNEVSAVFVAQAPSHNGLVNDVARLGATLRDAGSSAWFVVDSCQAVGQLPVSLADFSADFVYASGRKFLRGPRGSGMMAVGARALAELDAHPVDVSGAEWTGQNSYTAHPGAIRFESYERSYAALLGLIVAADYLESLGVERVGASIRRNAEYLRSRISGLAGWEVLDRGRERSGIVTAQHQTLEPQAVVSALREQKINVSLVRPAINPVDLSGRSCIRFSPHAYNTCSELDTALSALAALDPGTTMPSQRDISLP